MTKQSLTQERLKELLHYDPETGIFTRLKYASSNAPKGAIAGYIRKDGYRFLGVCNNEYKASRVACLYMTGEWPVNTMDHINHIRHDDRWVNLRDVTHQENCKNRAVQSNNKSGYHGIFWEEARNKWQVSIKVCSKKIHLGRFINLSEAIEARKNAEIKYEFHKLHGV